MKLSVSLTVNGKPVSAEIESRTLLVDFLRERLRLTGTHVGCDTAQCGACTVLVDGKAVKACNMLAIQARGSEVTTIEGLAIDGTLHPMQAAFKQHHGLQCGFCTPGFLMTLVPFLEENPDPTEDEILHAISGNLCRCTGYQHIVDAVKLAAERRRQAQG